MSFKQVDRLIETNGQILDIAVRGDANAELAAKGIADLTVSFNEFKQEVREGFEQINQKIDTEVGSLRQEMNQRFDQLVTLIQERPK